MSNWKSVSESLPEWSDGYVNVKLKDGLEQKARFDEGHQRWVIPTAEGVIQHKVNDGVVTHWERQF